MKNKRHNLLGGRTLSNIIVICVGVLLFLLLFNFTSVLAFLKWFASIFTPFVAGIGIAYLLNMPMRFFEARLFKNLRYKRAVSILTTYVLAVLVLFLLLRMVIPQVGESVYALVNNLAAYLANLNLFLQSIGDRFQIDPDTIQSFMLSYNDLVNQIMIYARDLIPNILSYTMQIGSGLLTALTALIASIYMLAGKDKLLQQARRVVYALLPRTGADTLMRVGKLSNGVFSGFIGGKILDSAIIGAICFVFMSLMNVLSSALHAPGLRMPFTMLISIIVGVTNVIPFFGPFIGAIPSIMILLMVNPWGALWFGLFIIVLQQFDGNILGPKILGDSTGLPAMWVLVSIIVGQGLFGFAGMLLGVPTAAVLYSLTGEFIEMRLRKKGLNQTEGLRYAQPPSQPPPAEEATHEE